MGRSLFPALHVFSSLKRSLDSTLIYINIERTVFGNEGKGEFHLKVAKSPEEIKTLLDAGFEYVCEK